ncbi:unnamed protein product [Brassica rapa]|uniref:Uncharacterized protein n=1 Tax=Brassica campestris TaxID=3711 RepID=A0A8D9M6T9_BRACM|nr:unnamed protein product [Brassica rapa]
MIFFSKTKTLEPILVAGKFMPLPYHRILLIFCRWRSSIVVLDHRDRGKSTDYDE